LSKVGVNKTKSAVEISGAVTGACVYLFTDAGGHIPAIEDLNLAPEWKEFTMPFSDFNGTNGHDIMGILFNASMET